MDANAKKRPARPGGGAALLLAASLAGACSAGEPAVKTSAAAPDDGGNRIEVSGNAASGVGCNASVNSVNVSGAQLQGRTVIVQGRNVRDVHTNCPLPAARTVPDEGSVNSIRIR